LIDASLPRSTKTVIEALGHNAVDVRDILPPASPDADIAFMALDENRVIITRDFDFANILLYPPEKYPGIIVLKVRALKPIEINNIIELFLTTTSPETILHSLIILEPNRYRVNKVTFPPSL
jgi:predicted nuclease of predicted toxin-antitoxin system